MYEDVSRNFNKWVEQGYKIYIYSSGSVEAQKLLFANSLAGDLLSLISGHFDTNVGHKQESQSYSNIAEQLNLSSDKILFLTDIPKEGIAAEEAGMRVILLDRPLNPNEISPEIREKFEVQQNFDGIMF